MEEWSQYGLHFWQDANATYVSADKKTWTRSGPGRTSSKGKGKGSGGGKLGDQGTGKKGAPFSLGAKRAPPKENPIGKDGKVMRCRIPGCGSEWHFEKDCPKRSTLETTLEDAEGEASEVNETKLTSLPAPAPSLDERSFSAGPPANGVIQAFAVFETRWIQEGRASVLSAGEEEGPRAKQGEEALTRMRRKISETTARKLKA